MDGIIPYYCCIWGIITFIVDVFCFRVKTKANMNDTIERIPLLEFTTKTYFFTIVGLPEVF